MNLGITLKNNFKVTTVYFVENRCCTYLASLGVKPSCHIKYATPDYIYLSQVANKLIDFVINILHGTI